MDFRNIRIVLSLFVVLLLSACGSEPCIRDCDENGDNCRRECGSGHCVDADDWGYPKIYVPANGNDPAYNNSLRGPVTNAYVDAIDSRQVILDADKFPLIITIGKRDQWTSWFGGDINYDDNGRLDADGFDGGRTVPDRECDYRLVDGKSSAGIDTATPGVFGKDLSPTTIKLDKTYDNIVKNCRPLPNPLPIATEDLIADCQVPCYYRRGMGLYVGLAPNNAVGATTADQVALAYHIPDAKVPDGRTAYVDKTPAQLGVATQSEADELNMQNRAKAEAKDGYLVRGLASSELPGSQTGDRLFFKIVDKAYVDNTGGYNVKIKEGTRSIDKGPLEKIVSVFVDPVNIVMQRIYNGIVSSSDFRGFVQALLVLYIAFFGYNIMIGGPDSLKKDVFVRIFKVGLIMVLISDRSWEFFYNHMFAAFLSGVQGVAGLMLNPFGDYDPNNPWYSMDQTLAKLWSSETWTKISATLISNFPLSLIFIPGMLWGLVWFMIALAKAIVVYLVMFAVIAILITLAPIFLILMLFEKTKDYTKEWFDQIFVAGLQQIILMAALGMFAAVIVMYMQKTVGYTTCWNVWLDARIPMPGEDIKLFDFRFWMPDISDVKGMVWADANGDGIKEVNEMAVRYIDAPYLHPVYDSAKTAQMVNYGYWSIDGTKGGGVSPDGTSTYYYISILDVIFFIGSIYLMRIFMPLVETVANTLKSGSATQSANVFSGGNALAGSFNEALRGAGGKGGGLLGGGLDNLGKAGKSIWGSETAAFAGRKTRGALDYLRPRSAEALLNKKASQLGDAAGRKATQMKQDLMPKRTARLAEQANNQKKAVGNAFADKNAYVTASKVFDLMSGNLTSAQKTALRHEIEQHGYKDMLYKQFDSMKNNGEKRDFAAIERNLKLMAGEQTVQRSSTPTTIDERGRVMEQAAATPIASAAAKVADTLSPDALRKQAEVDLARASLAKVEADKQRAEKDAAEKREADRKAEERRRAADERRNAIDGEIKGLQAQKASLIASGKDANGPEVAGIDSKIQSKTSEKGSIRDDS